jgi:hypothetical protein
VPVVTISKTTRARASQMALRAMREGQTSRALAEYLTKEIFSFRLAARYRLESR